MSNSLNDKLNVYYKEIYSSALCAKKQKSDFLKELKEQIEEYIENSPEADIDEIKSVFGSPEEIAAGFSAELSQTEIRKKLGIRKIIIAAVLAALLIWGVFAVISLIDVHTEAHGYFKEGMLNLYNFLFIGGVL